jgi:hypothetical protein
MRPATNYENLVKTHTGMAYHINAGRGIDYETRMRYVNSDGVRFWEHGAFDILQSGDRNPDGRKTMSKLLGVECVKVGDYKGELYTPEGVKVTKSQLVGNPVLWVDREHMLVVNCDIYEPIKYAWEGAPPVSRRKIKVAFPDPIAEKTIWPEIKKWLDWVKAQKALGGEEPDYTPSYRWNRIIDGFIYNPQQPVGDLYSMIWHYDEVAEACRRKFRIKTRITRDYPWLKTTKPS